LGRRIDHGVLTLASEEEAPAGESIMMKGALAAGKQKADRDLLLNKVMTRTGDLLITGVEGSLNEEAGEVAEEGGGAETGVGWPKGGSMIEEMYRMRRNWKRGDEMCGLGGVT
jgi:hypothetical protein